MEKVNLTTLTIFANFFIDNEERFQRMKDSFKSFEKIQPQEWIINIRGNYKYKAGEYLENNISQKVSIEYLNSTFGWTHDTRKLFKNINGEYIFNWIEDHILISEPQLLNNCVLEMKKYNIDQLWYSWFNTSVMRDISIVNELNRGKFITSRKLNSLSCAKIREFRKKNGFVKDFCTVSAQSIIKKTFFKKILFSNKPFFKRYPRKTPHDFEKRSKDEVTKEIIHAFPNQELFVSIDDDFGCSGYSLISRGVYPNRMSRKEIAVIENPSSPLRKKIKKIIPKIFLPIIVKFVGYLYRFFYTLNIIWNK